MLSNSLTDSKRAKFYFVKLFLVAAVVYAPACSNNYLESFATKTDNDSLFWTAQSYLWTNDYVDAIAACTNMSANYLALDNVAIVCASAFAGRCGYSLNWMITNLPTITPPVFLAELVLFNTAATNQQVSDCEMAETILQGIGTSAQRSQDANMFMALLAIYKIGIISSNIASSGTGTVNPAFNPCTMPAADQQAIGVAFYDLNMSLQQLSSVQMVAPIALAVQGECTALAAIGYDLCNVGPPVLAIGSSAGQFNPLNLTAPQLLGATSLIHEGFAFGLNTGACGGGATGVPACQCP